MRDECKHGSLRRKCEVCDLERQLSDYQAAFPTCDKHRPSGGARAGCLVCAGVKYSYAISRIDYACGEPNEMECSAYDVHQNEDEVVKKVQGLAKQLSDALEREAKLRQELAIEFGNSDRLAKALQIAIRQNSHDMLLTGEELRKCESALALHESGDEPTYTDCPIHGRHEGDCPRC